MMNIDLVFILNTPTPWPTPSSTVPLRSAGDSTPSSSTNSPVDSLSHFTGNPRSDFPSPSTADLSAGDVQAQSLADYRGPARGQNKIRLFAAVIPYTERIYAESVNDTYFVRRLHPFDQLSSSYSCQGHGANETHTIDRRQARIWLVDEVPRSCEIFTACRSYQ